MNSFAREVYLQRVPQGFPVETDFALRDFSPGEPADGEALVEVLALSLDPYQRSAIAGRHLSASIRPGDTLRGDGLVRVMSSRHARWRKGELWVAACGWRSHALLGATEIAAARPVDARWQPPTLALGVLGMPGLTAWAGVRLLSGAQAGDTFVVSAAGGPVGATAGQLARRLGCRVIGIAGGADKCAWVKEAAGFAACIDHRRENLRAALDEHCPRGIDVYFDNVGGDTLDAVSERLAPGARVVLCGLAAQYNGAPLPGPNPGLFIRARATLRGLVVYDHWERYPEMAAEIAPLVAAGEMAFREDRGNGLPSAPAAFCRLMRGENQGKALVILDETSGKGRA